MFQVSIRSLLKVRVYIYHHLRVQPSEIDGMPFYEYEYLLEDLKQLLEERQVAEKGQSPEEHTPSVARAMSDARKAMPKMPAPKFPGIPPGLLKR